MKLFEAENIAKEKLENALNKNEIKVATMQLLQYFWDVSAIDFYTKKDTFLNENQTQKYIDALEKLQQNMPIQYVIGETVFYKTKLKVNKNVLIPRPETEELVDWIISENKTAKTILDIGTGSGCIAISLAKNIENVKVFAVDISKQAIEAAKKNAQNNNVEINFIEADILLPETKIDNKFDVIVSNPPYVRNCEKEKMKKNILDFEPHLALFVPDNNALKFYESIAHFAKNHLSKNGKIYLETNEYLYNETEKIFTDHGFSKTEIKKDLSNKNRMLKAEQ